MSKSLGSRTILKARGRQPRSSSSHIFRFGPSMRIGAGHGGFGPRTRSSQAVRLGHRAQRPYPSIDAEGRRPCHLPHREVDRLPAARARNRALARTLARDGRKTSYRTGYKASRSSTAKEPSRSPIHRLRRVETADKEHYMVSYSRRRHAGWGGGIRCFLSSPLSPPFRHFLFGRRRWR